MAPPLYTQWFKVTYQDFKLEQVPDGKYVLQTTNGMQGRKDSGWIWHLLLKKYLKTINSSKDKQTPLYFLLQRRWDNVHHYISTDNFLICYYNPTIYPMLEVHIKKICHRHISRRQGLEAPKQSCCTMIYGYKYWHWSNSSPQDNHFWQVVSATQGRATKGSLHSLL